MSKLLNIDCLKYLETEKDEIFDLVIADPPYFEIYGDFDFVWESSEDYINWCKKWLLECHRVLKANGSLYLWGKIGFNKGYPLFKLADWVESNKLFVVRNWITQRNSRGRGNKKGFMEAREELIFMTKGKDYIWNNSYTEEKSNRKDMGFDGKPRKNEYKRCSDVWIDIAEASQSSKERFCLPDGKAFPTVKSIKLCERIILASTTEGSKVFIPFGGSGSEALACQKHNRSYVLTELNSDYFEFVIKPRLIL